MSARQRRSAKVTPATKEEVRDTGYTKTERKRERERCCLASRWLDRIEKVTPST